MSSASIPLSVLPVQPATIKRFLDKTLKLPPLQQQGFTHPLEGHWCMMPEEIELILAQETKAVTQVILRIFFQTIGQPGNGPGGRRLWARMSLRHFTRKTGMSLSQVQEGVKHAIARGYILRRRCGRSSEYAIRFRNIEYATYGQVWKTEEI